MGWVQWTRYHSFSFCLAKVPFLLFVLNIFVWSWLLYSSRRHLSLFGFCLQLFLSSYGVLLLKQEKKKKNRMYEDVVLNEGQDFHIFTWYSVCSIAYNLWLYASLFFIFMFPVLLRIAGSSYAAYVGLHMELVFRQAFSSCGFTTVNAVLVIYDLEYFYLYLPNRQFRRLRQTELQ